MSPPKKILVPVDFSDRSKRGVSYAAELARPFDASLVLVCNVGLPEQESLEEYALAERLSVGDAARLQLETWARDLAGDIKTTARVSFVEGTAEGILAMAENEDVDMIVIASHGRAGMTRWLLGSVAEKIARSAEVPVVLVPARD